MVIVERSRSLHKKNILKAVKELKKMPLYEFSCPICKKQDDVHRPIAHAGKSHKCTNCGSKADRVYSAGVEKERLYDDGGKRFTSFSQHEKYLKTKGRVLTEATSNWSDIKRMAKEGQRRTLLAQKGHY